MSTSRLPRALAPRMLPLVHPGAGAGSSCMTPRMGLKQHFVHGRGYAEVSVDLQRQILGGEQVVEHIVSDKPFDHFVRFAAFAEACPQAGSPCPCEALAGCRPMSVAFRANGVRPVRAVAWIRNLWRCRGIRRTGVRWRWSVTGSRSIIHSIRLPFAPMRAEPSGQVFRLVRQPRDCRCGVFRPP